MALDFQCGISNLGNTCFINASLQCLARIRQFAEYFRKGEFEKRESWASVPEHIRDMCKEWQDLADALRSTTSCNLIPNRFYKLFKNAAVQENMDWLVIGQNDAHEFMMFFLDVLHKGVGDNWESFPEFARFRDESGSKTLSSSSESDLNETLVKMARGNWGSHFAKAYHPWMTQMFHGQFLTIISSKHTAERSFCFDPFSSINIAVPQTTIAKIRLEDCLDQYFSTEKMENDTQWDSPKAGKVDAAKATRIWKLPEVLIVSLKRFTLNGGKINTLIEYPITDLEMSPYCVGEASAGDTKYDLVGVVIHIGFLLGGHYIAIVRNPGGGWMVANDSVLRKVDISQVSNQVGAYTLMYQKHSSLENADRVDMSGNETSTE